jgi:predicted MFS family arabinose efflux permease
MAPRAARQGEGADTMPVWRATLAGLCASLVGIGLARFAYTPLIPALIGAGWFAPADAAYLAAANLAGYVAGALAARPIAARASAVAVLRLMMLLAAASFVACATPLSFAWYFAWRFASGLAGGVLMVLAATTVLPHVPAGRRGLAAGAIFAGIGIGVLAAATLVPLLMRQGLAAVWLALGGLSLALALIAWPAWPRGAAPAPVTSGAAPSARPDLGPGARAIAPLVFAYGLNAAGLVPHMVFLVDFVARGLGQGIGTGAHYWVVFGIGAVAGPPLAGLVADRIGFARALRAGFVVQAAAVALLAVTDATPALVISSLVAGAFTPGVVPLVLGRIQELIPSDARARQAAWGAATTAFALFQAGGAYSFTFVFARSGESYARLFALGAVVLAFALAIDLAAARRRR